MTDKIPLHVLVDDMRCSKCKGFLDTGLECTECGHDMRPEIYPEEFADSAAPGSETVQ